MTDRQTDPSRIRRCYWWKVGPIERNKDMMAVTHSDQYTVPFSIHQKFTVTHYTAVNTWRVSTLMVESTLQRDTLPANGPAVDVTDFFLQAVLIDQYHSLSRHAASAAQKTPAVMYM